MALSEAEAAKLLVDGWDEIEGTGETTEAVEAPPAAPPLPEPLPSEQDEEEQEQPDEPAEPDEGEQDAEQGEEQQPDEQEDEEEDGGTDAGFDTDDPEILAYLSKYGGDPLKALKGAADLQRAYGRQGSELAEARQREQQLQAMLQETQALSPGEPLSAEQQEWAAAAAASGNPAAYVRQAIGAGEFDLARAVCRDWAQENPFEAGRAGQYIDEQQAQLFQTAAAPQQFSSQQIMEALADELPEMRSWWGQMAEVARNLGPDNPTVAESRSPDPRVAMSGLMRLYEITRDSAAAVKTVKAQSREAADGARAKAAVSSATTSPKRQETPRRRELLPGLYEDDLDTEFART